MRNWLLLYPKNWRDRYAEEFTEVFEADPRTFRKWVDLARTALEHRFRQLFEAEVLSPFLITLGLAVTAMVDLALGVGMDERLDPVTLAQHWWGAPFIALLLLSAVLVLVGSAQSFRTGARAMRALVATVLCAVGALAGSALFALTAFHLAAVGAGAGLVLTVTLIRAGSRQRLSGLDANLLGGLALIVFLGWRTASSPVGPAILLVVAGLLVAATLAVHRPSDRLVTRYSPLSRKTDGLH